MSALMLCCESGHSKMTKLVLQSNADPNLRQPVSYCIILVPLLAQQVPPLLLLIVYTTTSNTTSAITSTTTSTTASVPLLVPLLPHY